ncbi:MAG: AIR carboxylase family protein [Candidatus Bathyarchaeota archaeon]|nr:AIR carboxylase family protein [Candidatus Bathyarchaeota archaeon]
MGSKNDLPFAKKIGDFLRKEGLTAECEYTVSSAHRTPSILLEKLRKNEESGDNIVYVTVAGLSDALSGFAAGFSSYPVIACPPDINKLGLSKAFSSVMTPRGVPVLLASNPENAALAAAKILGLANPSLRGEVRGYIQKQKEQVVQADREIAGGDV